MANDHNQSVSVGVFWCINGHIYGERESLKVTDHAVEGMVDSHLEHWRIWDAPNQMFEAGICREDHEYFSFPRGRVLYDVRALKYVVYCDQVLMNPNAKKQIANFFGIAVREAIWRRDIHYSTDGEAIRGFFEDGN